MKKFCITFLIILFFLSTKAYSVCVCDNVLGVRESADQSSAILKGMIEEIVWLNPLDYLVKIRVDKSWKGPKEVYVWIASSKSEEECGFEFVTGHEYLIYAYNVTKNLLSTSKCSRTKHWRGVTEQEKRLLGKVIYGNELN